MEREKKNKLWDHSLRMVYYLFPVRLFTKKKSIFVVKSGSFRESGREQ